MAQWRACTVLAFCMLLATAVPCGVWGGADSGQIGTAGEPVGGDRLHELADPYLEIPACPEGGAAPVGLAYFIDAPTLPIVVDASWWGDGAGGADASDVELVTYRVGRFEITEASHLEWGKLLLLDGRPWFTGDAGLVGVLWMRGDGSLVPYIAGDANGYPVAVISGKPVGAWASPLEYHFVAMEILPRILGRVSSTEPLRVYCRPAGDVGFHIGANLEAIVPVRNDWQGVLEYRLYRSSDGWNLDGVMSASPAPSELEIRQRAREIRRAIVRAYEATIDSEGESPMITGAEAFAPTAWNFALYEEMVYLLLAGHRREAGLFLDWAWPAEWPGKGDFLMDVVQRVRRFQENPGGF